MVQSFVKEPISQSLKKMKKPFTEKYHLLKKVYFRQNLCLAKGEREGIKLYDANDIETCTWPENEEGAYAKKFLTPLIKNGVTNYIENIQTDLRVMICDDLVLPITINEAEYDNSYVCSPYSYYVSYAKESLSLLAKNWVYYPLNALLSGVAKVLIRYHVNKVVMVNNWFYSTNLTPSLEAKQLEKIAQFLKEKFPDYALIFRSVDGGTNPVCHQNLQKIGFNYIASREIFFINPHQSTLFDSRLFKSDLKLLRNSGYEIIDGENLIKEDLPRLLSLYQDLFIEKYSNLNPQFTNEFLHLIWKEKLMHFKGLKKDGKIDGVVGFVQKNGWMFCPFFGYDRSLPKDNALYRLLSTVLMLEAYDRQLLFHQSSGASMFKKIRKAHSTIEYMAVYTQHLKLKRQIPWQVLKKMCNSLGILYMKRY